MLSLLLDGCTAVQDIQDWLSAQMEPERSAAPAATPPKRTAALPPPTVLQPELPRPVKKPSPRPPAAATAPSPGAPAGPGGSRGETPPAAVPAGQMDPEKLIGMSQSETTALLGEPGERADAPPATVWRYAAGRCELDLYFYLDLQSQVLRVLHYEVKGDEPTDTRHDRCFEQLVAEHRDRTRGDTSGGEGGAYRPR